MAQAKNADPEFAAKHAERGRERMRKLHADPEFAAKHAERMRKLHADRACRRHGLQDHELAEWRAIKARGFSGQEAAQIVIRARKGAA